MFYKIGMTLIVGTLALMIPTGIYLALTTDNAAWLMLCIPIFLFLS